MTRTTEQDLYIRKIKYTARTLAINTLKGSRSIMDEYEWKLQLKDMSIHKYKQLLEDIVLMKI